jgi:uncharacterized protein (DUF302 family)
VPPASARNCDRPNWLFSALPQKALIWEDANGQVWFSYNDPKFLALRHDTQGCDAVLNKVATALGNFAAKAE